MAKYYVSYSTIFKDVETDSAIIEAKSLAAAKKAIREKMKEEYKSGFIDVRFDDAYRTSDDARSE